MSWLGRAAAQLVPIGQGAGQPIGRGAAAPAVP
jgi:hypothetical protein